MEDLFLHAIESLWVNNHASWSYECATSFQEMPNDIFRDFFDIISNIDLDDILISSKTQEEHDIHVR